jgi:ubiquinone/menaquinone biosynthesis C-methylase UbiE
LQAEQDRLDLQHAMLMMATVGKLAHAPMDYDPEYVMDVATGTGIWAIQFGTLDFFNGCSKHQT